MVLSKSHSIQLGYNPSSTKTWCKVLISEEYSNHLIYPSFAHQSEHVSNGSCSPAATPFHLRSVLSSASEHVGRSVRKRCPMDDTICCSKVCKYSKTLPSRQQCWWSVGLCIFFSFFHFLSFLLKVARKTLDKNHHQPRLKSSSTTKIKTKSKRKEASTC